MQPTRSALFSFLGTFFFLLVIFGVIGGTSTVKLLIAAAIAALVGARVYLRER